MSAINALLAKPTICLSLLRPCFGQESYIIFRKRRPLLSIGGPGRPEPALSGRRTPTENLLCLQQKAFQPLPYFFAETPVWPKIRRHPARGTDPPERGRLAGAPGRVRRDCGSGLVRDSRATRAHTKVPLQIRIRTTPRGGRLGPSPAVDDGLQTPSGAPFSVGARLRQGMSRHERGPVVSHGLASVSRAVTLPRIVQAPG